jgi:tetratricopeptide (TPR) repeat protein
VGAAIAVLITVVVTVACGTTREEWSYLREVRDADRLADERRYEAALEEYRELSSKAPADVDQRYLRYRSALMLEKMGHYEEAIAAYEAIWENPYSVYDNYPGRALNNTAGILRDQYGDTEEAEEIYWGVVKAYPNGASADDALFELSRIYEDRPSAFIERVQEIYPQLMQTEVADNLVWEVAIRLHESLDDCPAAMDLYDLLITHFHRSGYVDNAIWNTSECLRSLGRIEDEYELLEDFIGAREISILIGDYNYKFYHPAFMRLAEIEENRGDLAKAVEWYRRFQKTFKFSLEWDDTQFVIVKHLLELGRDEEAEEALEELKEEWPQSYFIEPIKNLLAYGEREE